MSYTAFLTLLLLYGKIVQTYKPLTESTQQDQCASLAQPQGPWNISSGLLFLASWQCGTHLEGCIRCKHWAFVWAHDALRSGEQTEQDGPFTQYVPRRLKEPDLSAPVPQRQINVSIEHTMFLFHEGKRGLLILPFDIWTESAPDTRKRHAHCSLQHHITFNVHQIYDMMYAMMYQFKSEVQVRIFVQDNFCSKA